MSSSAPSKIILFGEHAAVYGFPAIAAPVKSLYTTVEIIESSSITIESNLNLNVSETESIKIIISIIVSKLKISNNNFSIKIESNIPIKTGMGSSASIAVSLIRELAILNSIHISNEKLNEIAFECEKVFHGNPSGIDNTVITYEKPVYFVKGKPLEFIKIKESMNVLIANTGIRKQATKDIVFDVRVAYEKNKEKYEKTFGLIGDISKRARQALEKGEISEIGRLMNENHRLLQQIDVSCPELDNLVLSARKNGAIGAKLVGAGRGGNMIALVKGCDKEKIREALLKNGAVAVICEKISGHYYEKNI